MPTTQDEQFAEAVIEQGLVSKDTARGFLAEIERAEVIGASTSLDVLLVKKGFLSREQADAVLQALVGMPGNIGGFELIKEIGHGPMGAVYKARQVAMDRLVALKVLSPGLAENESYRQRFIRDARAVARLSHENIIQVYDAGEADGYDYFAMEYIDGESLAKRLEREGNIGEAEALDIVVQVCGALAHARTAGNIIHGDINPRNIFITNGDVAKLADVGLARAAQADGLAVVSPLYLSPEQAVGSRDIDTRSDIYSLGAVLFHMVTGVPPFTGATPEEVVSKHLTAELPSPRSLNPALSVSVCRLLTVMMAKAREVRYQTPEELLRDVQKVRQGLLPQRAVKLGLATAGAQRAPARAAEPRSHSGTLVVSVVLAVVAAAAVILIVKGSGAPPTVVEKDTGPGVAASKALGEAERFQSRSGAITGEVISKYEKVASDHTDTLQGREARARVQKLRADLDDEAKAAFAQLKTRVDKLAEAEHYARAIEALEGHPRRLRTGEWDEAVITEIARLQKKLRIRIREIREKAEQRALRADYEGAIEVLREALAFGDQAMTQYVADKTIEYRDRRAEWRQRQKSIEAARAELEFDGFLVGLMKLERERSYGAAVRACGIFAKKHTGVYAKQALGLKAQEEAAQKAFDEAVDALKELAGSQVEIRARGILLKGRLRNVSDATFTVETDIAAITKKLVEIDPGDLLALAGVTGKDRAGALRRAGFFLVLGAHAKAEEAIKKLGDKDLLNEWRARIEKREELRTRPRVPGDKKSGGG